MQASASETVELLYFDHDHGVERLLFVRMDRASRTVHFRFERAPDPSYEDEEGSDVPIVSLSAATECPGLDQFCAFCHAVVAAMRETPFSLQDPSKTPFAAMPHAALVLDGIAAGVPGAELTCRVPAAIAAELGL